MTTEQIQYNPVAASILSSTLPSPDKDASTARHSLWQRIGPIAVLILATIIWGSTFLITQNAIKLSGPFTYLFFCFGFGALTLSLIFRRQIVHVTRTEIKGGVLIRYLAGQTLSLPAWFGCACIFLGMIAGSIRWHKKTASPQPVQA